MTTTADPKKTTESETVHSLSRLLADTVILSHMAQNYHWNVEGPLFYSLHTFFETQYKDLAAASDEIAERIRALGAKSPGTYQEFSKLASVKESGINLSSEAMIKELIQGYETAVKTAKAVNKSSRAEDPVSEGIALARIQAHQKALWMMKSLLA